MFRNAIAGLKALHILNLITWCQFVPKVLTPMHIPTYKGVWEFTSPWTLCIVRLLKIYHSVGTKKTHWGFCLHFLIPVMLRVFHTLFGNCCFLWNACLYLCLRSEFLIFRCIGVFLFSFSLWFFNQSFYEQRMWSEWYQFFEIFWDLLYGLQLDDIRQFHKYS